jgi:hypothetical protein
VISVWTLRPLSGRFSMKVRSPVPASILSDPGGSVMQVDDEASGFPADFEFSRKEQHLFWDYVKIGEGFPLTASPR